MNEGNSYLGHLALVLVALFVSFLLATGFDWSLAGLIMAAVILLAVGLLLGLYALRQSAEIEAIRREHDAAPRPAQVIEALPAPSPASPGRALWAAPFAPSRPRTVVSIDADGRRIEASYEAVARFITDCFPVPNRDKFWTGSAEDYGKAALVLSSGDNAPLIPSGRTFVWRAGIRQQDLFDWLTATVAKQPPDAQTVQAVF